MDENNRQAADQSELENQVRALAKTVRRQVVALWILIGLFALAYVAPWVMYFARSEQSWDARGATTTEVDDRPPFETEEPFDNDFHARPPEEKAKRATVILVTKLERDGDRHQEIVSEIIKQKPGVRLYYKVGDEYERLSHQATPECEGCEGQGQVVFMLGNPAMMASSYSYEGDRIDGMGGIPLDELRRLAEASLAAQP